MNLITYLPIIIIFIVLFLLLRNQKTVIARKIIKKRRGDTKEMIELAKRFIGKECLIYSLGSSSQLDGTIKEVSNSAILIEKDGKTEAINLDYVTRIREYPTNKKGKKKSIVVD